MSMVKDSVCGVNVDERASVYKAIRNQRVYHFHSSACQAEFTKNPEEYMGEAAETRHATHYGGYCGVQGCGKPARGVAWYMYFALLFFVLLLVLLLR